MASTLEYSLFSANVYGNSSAVRHPRNVLPVPQGWTKLGIQPVGAGEAGSTASGFMASAYQRGNEIVIAYAGTTDEENRTELDWLYGNVPAATATILAPQIREAAIFYLHVLRDNPGASISFTGHSLGGGLASLMAVFFDRHATVFDEGPFQKSADSLKIYNELRLSLISRGFSLPSEFSEYVSLDPSGILIPSPSRVARQHHVDQFYIKGEVLSLLNSLEIAAASTVVGLAIFGTPLAGLLGAGVTKVNGTETVLDLKVQQILGWKNPKTAVDLHSISLLSGLLLSPAFLATIQAHPELLPRIFADGVYANAPRAASANLLDMLIQREYVGEGSLGALVVDVEKINLTEGLTAFRSPAAPGVEELNVAAIIVDAILANLYLQGKNRVSGVAYSQFATFIKNITGGIELDVQKLSDEAINVEPGLERLLIGLLNDKSVWLPGGYEGARWSLQSGSEALSVQNIEDARRDVVFAGDTGATISTGGGQDLLVGRGGDDSLVGGADGDILYGGLGSDSLEGGEGDDWLYGGGGGDTYKFSGNFGSDVIIDAGGGDSLQIDLFPGGMPIGKKVKDNLYETDDGSVSYFLRTTTTRSGLTPELVISLPGDKKIRIQGWDKVTANFGIQLSEVPVAPPSIGHVFLGDFEKAISPIESTKYLFWDGVNPNDTRISTSNPGPRYLSNYVSNGSLSGAEDVIYGTEDADSISGLGGNDALQGMEGADFILGGGGSDLLLGGTGEDSIYGEAGNDFIFGSAIGQIRRPTNTTDAPPVANGPEIARGFSWVIYDAPDVDGVDIYTVDGMDIMPTTSQGYVESTGNYIEGGGGDDRIVSGTGADTVFGGENNDTITGMDNDDILFGDAGNDRVEGDGYVIDSANDVITEIVGGGYDVAYAAINWAMSDNVESVYLEGDASLTVTGNALGNAMVGRSRGDTLYGMDGNDIFLGLGGDDLLDGGAGNDLFNAGDGADTLVGGAGNDDLNGEAGDDLMIGGAGDDVYVVTSSADSIVELANEGYDHVDTYVNWTLGDNQDSLRLYGAAQMGTGNSLSNGITGSANADTLRGLGGVDILIGLGGNDTIEGGTGNDLVNGMSGNDTYRFWRGDGSDTLTDSDDTAGNSDLLAFQDAASDQLWFRHVGNNLVVSIIGGTDRIAISGWYAGDSQHIETFTDSDGKVLSHTNVEALVNAMAVFSPPVATTLPSSYQEALGTVISSSWT